MNVIKEHNTAKKKKGNVVFGAAPGGKWTFRSSDKESGAWSKIMRVPGGLKVAERIADTISKSWLRTAGKKLSAPDRLDAKGRRQIDYLIGLRTLKDWTGEPEWWHNVTGDQPAMPMVYPHQQKTIVPPKPISPEDLGIPELSVVEAEAELVPA